MVTQIWPEKPLLLLLHVCFKNTKLTNIIKTCAKSSQLHVFTTEYLHVSELQQV